MGVGKSPSQPPPHVPSHPAPTTIQRQRLPRRILDHCRKPKAQIWPSGAFLEASSSEGLRVRVGRRPSMPGADPALCELSTEPSGGRARPSLPRGPGEHKHSRTVSTLAPSAHPLYSLVGSAPAAAATPVAAERVRRSSSERGERPEVAGTGTHAAGVHGAHVAGTTGPSSTHRRLLLLNLLGSKMSSTEKEVGRGGAAGRAAPAPSGTAGTVSLAASGGTPARGKMGSSARPSIASRAVAAGAGGAGPEPGPGSGGGSAGTSPGAAGPLALMPASGRSGGSGRCLLGSHPCAPQNQPQPSCSRPSWLVLPCVASATASGARRAEPVHLWRPRRRRPRAHTPHTRAPAGGRGVPLPSLARTPNWLRTVPSEVGGPGAGLTD